MKKFGSKPKHGKTHFVDQHVESSNNDSDSDCAYDMFHMENRKGIEPYTVTVKINGYATNMKIDTGASVSIISDETYKAIGAPDLHESNAKLKTYTGDEIPVLGTCGVAVEYKSKSVNIPITVVRNWGPSLMGRDWLGEFQLDWSEILSISEFNKSEELKKTLDKFEDVFRDELGAVKGMQAKIYVDQAA